MQVQCWCWLQPDSGAISYATMIVAMNIAMHIAMSVAMSSTAKKKPDTKDGRSSKPVLQSSLNSVLLVFEITTVP